VIRRTRRFLAARASVFFGRIRAGSLVPQGVDRVEKGGLDGGDQADGLRGDIRLLDRLDLRGRSDRVENWTARR
jgi:hypothetical protein